MRLFAMLAALGLFFVPGVSGDAEAASLPNVYVDSAPNASGSPNYAPWRSSAFTKASTGAFVNMENGAFAGTTNFAATDALVYSTGDLGKRLHFVYFIPNATKAALEGNLEVRMSFDWDGTTYYDFAGTNATTFVAPNFANLVEINGGVAGTFGDAFWPNDNDAPPFSTTGSIYDETDAADIAAVAADMYAYQTFWKGEVRVRNSSTAPWMESVLTATLVDPAAAPVPTPMAATAGFGLMGGLLMKRRGRLVVA